ncbi:MAG: efflux RND transporter permease subunit, partial [Muribaculaceae bacterium]|nr:efflux RND transporter permease subunit [Muribaculaceae bacterium]
FLFTMTGMFKDFLLDFPWAILIILMGSFIIAELLVPFLQYALIKPTKAKEISENSGGKKHFSFLTLLQSSYDKLITWCFKYPIGLCAITLVVMVIGIWLFVKSPMQMMPIAERNQFAVEIFLPTNTSIERTSEIADSLEAILAKDDRVVSIANFHGCSSPRFQTTYAPQIGGPNFAQFIVNTVSNDATEDVLHEYTSKYEAYFPDAVILFKQLSYSDAAYPIELKISGSNLAELQAVSDTILGIMRRNPDITIQRTSLDMPSIAILVKPDAVQLSRIGKTTGNIELDLALRYSSGVPVGTLGDGKHSTDVVLKSTEADHSDANELSNGLLPTLDMTSVPLSQIADVVPKPVYGQISHLNGIKTIYLSALVP